LFGYSEADKGDSKGGRGVVGVEVGGEGVRKFGGIEVLRIEGLCGAGCTVRMWAGVVAAKMGESAGSRWSWTRRTTCGDVVSWLVDFSVMCCSWVNLVKVQTL